MIGLFDDQECKNAPLSSLSKKEFAARLGLSPARISQLVEQGLPVEASGRVPVEKATAWYAANIDPNRRKRGDGGDALQRSPRAQLDIIRAESARYRLEQERGNLIDRATANRHVFERARAERDSWLAWVSRAAPQVAGELGGDTAKAVAVLDRLVRDHLRHLSTRPLEDIGHDAD
jgi:hypothetical protein